MNSPMREKEMKALIQMTLKLKNDKNAPDYIIWVYGLHSDYIGDFIQDVLHEKIMKSCKNEFSNDKKQFDSKYFEIKAIPEGTLASELVLFFKQHFSDIQNGYNQKINFHILFNGIQQMLYYGILKNDVGDIIKYMRERLKCNVQNIYPKGHYILNDELSCENGYDKFIETVAKFEWDNLRNNRYSIRLFIRPTLFCSDDDISEFLFDKWNKALKFPVRNKHFITINRNYTTVNNIVEYLNLVEQLDYFMNDIIYDGYVLMIQDFEKLVENDFSKENHEILNDVMNKSKFDIYDVSNYKVTKLNI